MTESTTFESAGELVHHVMSRTNIVDRKMRVEDLDAYYKNGMVNLYGNVYGSTRSYHFFGAGDMIHSFNLSWKEAYRPETLERLEKDIRSEVRKAARWARDRRRGY